MRRKNADSEELAGELQAVQQELEEKQERAEFRRTSRYEETTAEKRRWHQRRKDTNEIRREGMRDLYQITLMADLRLRDHRQAMNEKAAKEEFKAQVAAQSMRRQ